MRNPLKPIIDLLTPDFSAFESELEEKIAKQHKESEELLERNSITVKDVSEKYGEVLEILSAKSA